MTSSFSFALAFCFQCEIPPFCAFAFSSPLFCCCFRSSCLPFPDTMMQAHSSQLLQPRRIISSTKQWRAVVPRSSKHRQQLNRSRVAAAFSPAEEALSSPVWPEDFYSILGLVRMPSGYVLIRINTVCVTAVVWWHIPHNNSSRGTVCPHT